MNKWLVAEAKPRGIMWMWYQQCFAFYSVNVWWLSSLLMALSGLVKQSGYRLNLSEVKYFSQQMIRDVLKNKNAKSTFLFNDIIYVLFGLLWWQMSDSSSLRSLLMQLKDYKVSSTVQHKWMPLPMELAYASISDSWVPSPLSTCPHRVHACSKCALIYSAPVLTRWEHSLIGWPSSRHMLLQ